MPQAPSIDTYIDNHRGNEQLALCVKLAIVRAILQAERKSKLFVDLREHEPQLNYNVLQQTWYNKIFRVLTAGVDWN